MLIRVHLWDILFYSHFLMYPIKNEQKTDQKTILSFVWSRLLHTKKIFFPFLQQNVILVVNLMSWNPFSSEFHILSCKYVNKGNTSKSICRNHL